MTDHLTKAQKILRKLKPDLITRYHVDTIGLFGSIVRPDFSPNSSDIDIIVSFTHPVGIEFIDLSNMLESIGRIKTPCFYYPRYYYSGR